MDNPNLGLQINEEKNKQSFLVKNDVMEDQLPVNQFLNNVPNEPVVPNEDPAVAALAAVRERVGRYMPPRVSELKENLRSYSTGRTREEIIEVTDDLRLKKEAETLSNEERSDYLKNF